MGLMRIPTNKTSRLIYLLFFAEVTKLWSVTRTIPLRIVYHNVPIFVGVGYSASPMKFG